MSHASFFFRPRGIGLARTLRRASRVLRGKILRSFPRMRLAALQQKNVVFHKIEQIAVAIRTAEQPRAFVIRHGSTAKRAARFFYRGAFFFAREIFYVLSYRLRLPAPVRARFRLPRGVFKKTAVAIGTVIRPLRLSAYGFFEDFLGPVFFANTAQHSCFPAIFAGEPYKRFRRLTGAE